MMLSARSSRAVTSLLVPVQAASMISMKRYVIGRFIIVITISLYLSSAELKIPIRYTRCARYDRHGGLCNITATVLNENIQCLSYRAQRVYLYM